MKEKRIHRAWGMLAGCCLLQGGSLGLIHNCRGIFYDPIIRELGFGMGAFTFYVLFFGACSCLILPVVGKLFARYDSRLLLGGASFVFAGSAFCMGLFRTLPAFYIAGAFQGLAGAFLMFFPAPYILGNWFKKKTGLAVGISAAVSGFVGVVGNPLGNAIIERFGWRIGYFVFGAVSLLMMLPVSVLLLRARPEDVGLLPYGQEEAPDAAACPLEGVPAGEAKRTVSFWLLIAAGMLAAMECAYYAHFTPLGVYFGYGSSVGALLVSLSMAGNMASKVLLGHIYDRWGLGISLAVGTGVTLLGFFLLLVDSAPVRMAGAFLYGFCMAMSAIMIAISVKDVYGSRGYGDLLGYSSLVSTLGTSLNNCLIGFMVDGFGKQRGYILSLWGGIVMTAVMGILFIVSIRGGRKTAERFRLPL